MSTTQAYIRARSLVAPRVERLHAILAERGEAIAARLHDDTLGELESWPELDVIVLDAMPKTECAIAGVYFSDSTPARIGIWSQVTAPRRDFTALHELGHHLQLHDAQLAAEFDDQPDQGAVLEELTCDAFAASILIPGAMTEASLGPDTPTAQAVVLLWRKSGASRAAVAVAAAGRLRSPGHVVLLDDADQVTFSSSVGELPLKRGSDQSRTSIVRRLRASSLPVVSVRDQRFEYRDRIVGTQMFAQATDMGGYTLIVAVAHNAPWENLSLSSAAPMITARWQTCTHCGKNFQVWGERCVTCGAGYCVECKHCDCESRVAKRSCCNCFLDKPAHLFVGELCDECAA